MILGFPLALPFISLITGYYCDFKKKISNVTLKFQENMKKSSNIMLLGFSLALPIITLKFHE